MNFKILKKIDLRSIFPKEIKDSLVCFTFVDSKVLNEAPDVASCNTNGYLYEIKKRKILRCLNLEDNPSTVTCYYLAERNKLVLFYLVFTTSNRLLIIRTINKRLKVVKEYQNVRGFQVYDFKLSGFPQIKINFFNKSESCICDFPVKSLEETRVSVIDNVTPKSLSVELKDLNECIDVLKEEYNHLKKICFSDYVSTNIKKIFLSSPDFSLTLNKATEEQLAVRSKWFKVLGTSLILGMAVQNISSEIIGSLDVVINHKHIKDYSLNYFQSLIEVSGYLFSNRRCDGFLKPSQEIYAVVSFEVPEFYTESELTLECFVTSKNLKNCFVKETFEINVCDIALQTTLDFEKEFNVEAFLAILAVKSETHLKIQTEDLEDGLMESLLTKNLGFKLIKPVKDKLFYCTSSYLKEVFVALRHIANNLSVWEMVLYTSQEQHIYFLVNALYDLLPDNSAVLCDDTSD